MKNEINDILKEIEFLLNQVRRNEDEITYLDLSNNAYLFQVKDILLNAISALKNNSKVIKVNFSRSNVDDDILKELNVLFLKNKTLEELNVSCNFDITLVGFTHIARILDENQCIKKLELEAVGLYFKKGSLNLIIDSLKNNKTLNSLNLEGNSLTSEDGEKISLLLDTNSTLVAINLEDNDKIDKKILNEINRKLYHNQLLTKKDYKDNNGNTPLHLLAQDGRADLIEKLINDAVWDVNVKNHNGFTPLHLAIKAGQRAVVIKLLELGASYISESMVENKQNFFLALNLAVIGNHCGVLEVLINHQLSDVLMSDNNNDTLVHIAAKCNSTKALSLLLSHTNLKYHDLSIKNKDGQFPIHIAAAAKNNSSKDILHYLIRQDDAAKNSLDANRHSPLYVAIRNHNEEIVRLLLKLGADIDDESLKLMSKINNSNISNQINNALSDRRSKQFSNNNSSNVALPYFDNLVLKGGGVKGIAYVGALNALAANNPQFYEKLQRIAGTSAGSITAFLLGIGYSPKEIEDEMRKIKFDSFMDGPSKEFVKEKLQDGFDLDALVKKSSFQTQFAWKEAKNITSAGINSVKNIQEKRVGSTLFNVWKTSVHAYNLYNLYSEMSNEFSGVFSVINIVRQFTKEGGFGIFPGEVAKKLFDSLLEKALKEKLHITQEMLKKEGISDYNLTFKELRKLRESKHVPDECKKRLKDIYFVGTNLSRCRTEIFSDEHTPDVCITDALRISMAFPFFFKPWNIYVKDKNGKRIKNSDDYYIDGGVLVNYPITIFDRIKYLSNDSMGNDIKGEDKDCYIHNPKTLGLYLSSNAEKKLLEQNIEDIQGVAKIEHFGNFLLAFIGLYLNHEENLHFHSDDRKRSVYIDSMGFSTLDFALNENSQNILIQSGQVAVNDFNKRSKHEIHEFKLSRNVLIPLIKYSNNPQIYFSESGIRFDNLKVDITHPQQVYNLYFCAEDDDISCLKELGININTTDAQGNNALHYAMLKCNDKLLKSLIKHEADRKKIIDNTKKVVSRLLSANIENIPNKNGWFVLDIMWNFRNANRDNKNLAPYCDAIILELLSLKNKSNQNLFGCTLKTFNELQTYFSEFDEREKITYGTIFKELKEHYLKNINKNEFTNNKDCKPSKNPTSNFAQNQNENKDKPDVKKEDLKSVEPK